MAAREDLTADDAHTLCKNTPQCSGYYNRCGDGKTFGLCKFPFQFTSGERGDAGRCGTIVYRKQGRKSSFIFINTL